MRHIMPPPEVRATGLFETNQPGLNIRATDFWKFYRQLNALRCTYRLAGHSADYDYPSWRLEIRRPKKKKFFEVEVAVKPGSSPSDDDLDWTKIFSGYCTGWIDAIESAKHAPFIDHMRSTASAVYGVDNSSSWGWVRPFRVVYPFVNAREPNAIYGEFKLVGGWEFNAEVDGAICCSFGIQPAEARELTKKAGGNAFLMSTHEGDGSIKYRLYHRGDMMQWDPWDIDNWRGRIIAGTQDF